MAGRKSLKDEIRVVQYMTELAEPTFKYIKAMYDAGEKADKKWASEQMMKLYAKAVPQDFDPERPLFIVFDESYKKKLNDIASPSETGSGQSEPIQGIEGGTQIR